LVSSSASQSLADIGQCDPSGCNAFLGLFGRKLEKAAEVDGFEDVLGRFVRIIGVLVLDWAGVW
jgi:hypothetical protein